jgi:molybdopterin converting factor small subunit
MRKMRVKVQFHGILSDWVGMAETEFALHEGAHLGDLLYFIGKRYARKMPEQLWDGGKNTFVKSVWAMREKEKILNPTEPLKNGEMIRFLLMQAGG